jgi:hypothetical protein
VLFSSVPDEARCGYVVNYVAGSSSFLGSPDGAR